MLTEPASLLSRPTNARLREPTAKAAPTRKDQPWSTVTEGAARVHVQVLANTLMASMPLTLKPRPARAFG